MNFTFPYLTQPLVVATRDDEFFIKDARDIGNRKIGVFEDSAVVELLKNEFYFPLFDSTFSNCY